MTSAKCSACMASRSGRWSATRFPSAADSMNASFITSSSRSNSDADDPRYNTQLGVYEENCGLRNVRMSWGHDEYLYHVFKNYLPEPALYMIRLPLVLCVASGRCVRLSVRRPRPGNAAARARVQSVRSLFEEPAAAGLERIAAVLFGADSQILSGRNWHSEVVRPFGCTRGTSQRGFANFFERSCKVRKTPPRVLLHLSLFVAIAAQRRSRPVSRPNCSEFYGFLGPEFRLTKIFLFSREALFGRKLLAGLS